MSDLISRQAAINALAKLVPYAIYDESTESYTNGLTDAHDLICLLPSAQPELTEDWWKTDHGYMWLCPHCGLPVHSDFEECLRCGEERPSAQPEQTGKWIETVKHYKDDEQEYDYIEVNCSECGVRRKIGWRDARCCPNCGVRLERGEE